MPVFQADIRVLPKQGVRDPEGTQILQHLGGAVGEHTISELTTGKFFRLRLSAESEQAATDQANHVCQKLLVNTVLNSYELDIDELDS